MSPPDTFASPRTGAVVQDRYRVERLLGRGGVGEVFEATQLALGEKVAIKFLKATWAHDPELRARLRREAVALARLRHPGIVSVVDFGEHEGEPYVVMELVRGRSLAKLEAGGPLPPHVVGPIFEQVLVVLETAHAVGIVHRDMKPENVMLLDGPGDPHVKVLDFGLAHVDDPGDGQRLTETGSVRGTPWYMSPEQCRGEDVGAATDVYAVGVMLYEAVAGAAPFTGDAASLMAQHLFLEPPRLAERGAPASTPVGLEPLLRRALHKDASRRPTAGALRVELAAALRGTDDAALLAAVTDAKVRDAGLSRSDRAITGVAMPKSSPTPLDASERAVVLVAPDDAHLPDVRTTLAVKGVLARHAEGLAQAERLAAEDELGALVVDAALARPEALAAARSPGARLRDLPLVVYGVREVADVAALVRIGAVEVTLAGAPHTDLVRRIRRTLARRGR